MLKLIKELLLKVIDNIDAGNSNITEEEAIELIKVIQSYTDRDQKLSKYQACQYLNISRASFDNYVKKGGMSGSYLYKNLYTKGGYSRVSMGMQQTTLDNLHYRVSDILYKTRYRHK